MGIEVASSFARKSAVPLDEAFVVADGTARDAIDAGIRYEGMLVYVTADQKMYQLQGGITDSDWKEAGGSGVTTSGTMASPTTIVVATGIVAQTSDSHVLIAKGPSAGMTAITANPQIAAGTLGQRKTIIGGSDTDGFSIADGNGVVLGYNETWESSLNNVLELVYNGAAWVKLFRSDR